MFPLTILPPLSVEGVVVSVADKAVAIYECSRFKLSMTIGIWILFILNFLNFSNN